MLTGYIDEFKTALEQEIAASKANSAASAVALTDGRLVAPVGSTFHYRFNVSTHVRVPPDTEGDLVLPNHSERRISVTVLEIQDLAVTLPCRSISALLSAPPGCKRI
jgi:hypothetical protein